LHAGVDELGNVAWLSTRSGRRSVLDYNAENVTDLLRATVVANSAYGAPYVFGYLAEGTCGFVVCVSLSLSPGVLIFVAYSHACPLAQDHSKTRPAPLWLLLKTRLW